MTTSGKLRNAVHNLEYTLTAIKAPTTTCANRLRWLKEAEPQAAAIEQRYGTPEPQSIKDWWSK